MLRDAMDVSESKAETLLRAISRAKRMPGPTSTDTAEAVAAYASAMAARNWIDFDDCVGLALRALSDDRACAALSRTISFRLGR